MTFQTEILDSFAEIETVRDEWSSIGSAAASPLLRWEWYYAAAIAFHRENDLKVVLVRRDGRVAAIAPLAKGSTGRGTFLSFIGVSALREPCGILTRDAVAAEALLRGLRKMGCAIILEQLEDSSDLVDRIVAQWKGGGRIVRRETGGTCFLPMQGKRYDDFLAGLPAKRRYDLKRLYKRVAGSAPLNCRVFNPRPDELQSTLDMVFAIEAGGWKGEQGSAVRFNPAMERFFRVFCASACAEGYLRIALLNLGDDAAAAMIGAELGGRFWVFKIGYDARWARYSPGIVMVNETIRYAFDRGLTAYEFLGSDEPWIHLWTGKDNVRRRILLAFYPYTIKGAVRFAFDAGRFIVGKLRNLMDARPTDRVEEPGPSVKTRKK